MAGAPSGGRPATSHRRSTRRHGGWSERSVSQFFFFCQKFIALHTARADYKLIIQVKNRTKVLLAIRNTNTS